LLLLEAVNTARALISLILPRFKAVGDQVSSISFVVAIRVLEEANGNTNMVEKISQVIEELQNVIRLRRRRILKLLYADKLATWYVNLQFLRQGEVSRMFWFSSIKRSRIEILLLEFPFEDNSLY
nr:hypothetical protein [Tanacetum cinerariifolium]